VNTLTRITVLLLLLLVASPLAALADESSTSPEEDDWGEATSIETTDETTSADTTPLVSVDPLTARMLELVTRYYTGIEVVPSEEEKANGLESIQMMVLSGIPITDIESALNVATRLHTPGRRVPFEIAVPLRVGTTMTGSTDAASAATPTRGSQPGVDPTSTFSPEEGARRNRVRQAEEARRTRYGLYQQWRSRTRVPRTLLSVGIPLLAGTYIIGFAISGVALLAGAPITHRQAWLAAIPIVGPAIIAGLTDGALSGMVVLTILQGAGAALIGTALAIPKNYPYDKDPTALRLGRKPDGRHALELRLRPSPIGAGIVGRF
jgi:hypothetical protein